MTINLADHRRDGAAVFSGRQYGSDLRRSLNLDVHDQDLETIEVVVPDGTLSLNSSFFLGLFGPSVRKFGAEGFKEKYLFNCPARIQTNINTGIRRALLTTNPVAQVLA